MFICTKLLDKFGKCHVKKNQPLVLKYVNHLMASVSKFKNDSCFIRCFSKMDIWMVLSLEITHIYVYANVSYLVFKNFSNLAFLLQKSPAVLSHNPLLKDKTSEFASLIMGSY